MTKRLSESYFLGEISHFAAQAGLCGISALKPVIRLIHF